MIKEIAGSQIYWPEYNINSLVEPVSYTHLDVYKRQTICEDATYTLNGTAQRYSSLSLIHISPAPDD